MVVKEKDRGTQDYQLELGELFIDNPFKPPEEIIDKKYELLKKACKHFYSVSENYRNLWDNNCPILPDELNLPEDLDIIPFYTTEDFKRYKDVVEDIFPEEPKEAPEGFKNHEIFYKQETPDGILIRAGRKNPFPEEVLCVSQEELDKEHPMVTSSATSGNPSIEYLTPLEKDDIYKAYLTATKYCIDKKVVDKMVLFGPSPEDTPTSQSALGRAACRELDKTKGRNSYFLLSECKFDPKCISKKAKELTDEASKNDDSIVYAFSTQLVYNFLRDMKKNGYSWNLGDKGYIAVGGGGWDGKKGRIITDAIEPKEFVDLAEEVLGIPTKNIHDIYGISEPVPFACYSDWSEKHEAFIHHVPRAYCSLQVVDENAPTEVLGEGEIGLLKIATPVAIAQPRVNILVYDLGEPVKIKDNEVVDYIFRGRAKSGKYEVKGCGLRESMKV